MQLHNNVRVRSSVDPPSAPGRNFDGAGQVVAVADTGFDKGSTTDVLTRSLARGELSHSDAQQCQ